MTARINTMSALAVAVTLTVTTLATTGAVARGGGKGGTPVKTANPIVNTIHPIIKTTNPIVNTIHPIGPRPNKRPICPVC
jgi:hypothetical protein